LRSCGGRRSCGPRCEDIASDRIHHRRALPDHCYGWCVRLEDRGADRSRWHLFRHDAWCAAFVAQVRLAPKGRVPAYGTRRRFAAGSHASSCQRRRRRSAAAAGPLRPRRSPMALGQAACVMATTAEVPLLFKLENLRQETNEHASLTACSLVVSERRAFLDARIAIGEELLRLAIDDLVSPLTESLLE